MANIGGNNTVNNNIITINTIPGNSNNNNNGGGTNGNGTNNNSLHINHPLGISMAMSRASVGNLVTTSGISINPTLVNTGLNSSGLGILIPASIKAIGSGSNTTSTGQITTLNSTGIQLGSDNLGMSLTGGIPVINTSAGLMTINTITESPQANNKNNNNSKTFGAHPKTVSGDLNTNSSSSSSSSSSSKAATSMNPVASSMTIPINENKTATTMNNNTNTSANSSSIESVINTDTRTNGHTDKREMLALLKLIKRFNLKQTEELLCKEANLQLEEAEQLNDKDVAVMLGSTLGDSGGGLTSIATGSSGTTSSSGLGGISGSGNVVVGGGTTSSSNGIIVNASSPNYGKLYDNAFQELRNFVDESLDIYKHELFMVLYPILVQVYLKLIRKGYTMEARSIVEKYGPDLDYYYRNDLRKLLLITKSNDLENNDFITNISNSTDKFILRMSRDAYSLFKRHIQDQKQELLSDIVQKYLHFDTYEGTARNKKICSITSGSLIGESRRSDNKIRVYYGLLKEIDFQTLNNPASILDDDDDHHLLDPEAPDRPKKKKPRRDPLFTKKTKSDPNAPAIDRIPLPELKDVDKLEKLKALREATKRITLNKDTLPSICIYTILNAHYQVCCAEISEDSSMMAVGFSDSIIKIWSLTPNKLREMKTSDQLQDIDKEADDVLARMMDDRNGEMSRCFYGHSGPVFRCTFSPDKIMLLSCSEDQSIRLWSLHTWTCIVVYRGHLFPVWDIRFSPHGYYFASCSVDKTIRLWSTDSNQPLRIFVGHLSDVDCIQFHPNSNYIASGSSDRTVRLWDVLNGQLVRLMTGHKGSIYSLAFSICGRYLASGSSDHCILIWDLSHGQLVIPLQHHTATIHTLSFSRDGNILSVGGMDCLLTLWDFTKLTEDYLAQQPANSRNPKMKNDKTYLLRSFPTKSTPFLSLHFTRRNLLLAVGFFKS